MKPWLCVLVLFLGVSVRAAAPVIQHREMVGGSLRLTILSDVGSTNEIQSLTDLGQTNWTVLSTRVVEESPYVFLDAAGAPSSLRFYRVAAFPLIIPEPPPGMVFIPAGTFTMGDSLDNETTALPLREVHVSAFFMDRHEVTKALWDEVYDWAVTNGYGFEEEAQGKAPTHPAQTMSWHDAVKWCNARSEKEGRVPAYYTDAEQTAVYRHGQVSVRIEWVKWNAGYRLPTEAEWEKAARGGAAGKRFPWTDTDTITHSRANYHGYPAADGGYAYDLAPYGYHPTHATGGIPFTSPVGSFEANGYGLHDMAGNVWEWCWDWHGSYPNGSQADPRGPSTGSDRVLRGGSWFNLAVNCRPAHREFLEPTVRDNDFGFRSVLSP